MKWLKRLFGREVQDIISRAKRVEQAAKGVASALDVFRKAKQQVLDANDALEKVGIEVDAEIQTLNALRSDINQKVVSHNLIADKFTQLGI
jgi:Cu/Ag efflux pump CusA